MKKFNFQKKSFSRFFLRLAIFFIFLGTSEGFADTICENFPDSLVVKCDSTNNPADTLKNKINCKNCDATSSDYLDGKSDAHTNYLGTRAFTVCFISTALVPPAGFITTLGYTFTHEKESNLNMPYVQLKENPNYYCGYTQNARKTRVQKSWMGFGSGLLFFGAIIYVIKITYYN